MGEIFLEEYPRGSFLQHVMNPEYKNQIIII